MALMYDDFTGTNGDPPDSSKWVIQAGAPDIQSNALEFNISSSPIEETVYATFFFPSDFSMQFDFSLSSPPSTNYWFFDIGAIVDDTHLMYSRRCYRDGQNYENSYKNGGGWVTATTAASYDAGQLKIERIGSNWYSYKKDAGDGDWVQLGSTVAIGAGYVQPFLRLISSTATPTVQGTADDFYLNDGDDDKLGYSDNTMQVEHERTMIISNTTDAESNNAIQVIHNRVMILSRRVFPPGDSLNIIT